MSSIRSILEIEVKGAEAIEKAARDVHGLSGYFKSSSHNTGRIDDTVKPTGGQFSGSNWNPAYIMGGSSTPSGPGGFNAGYTPNAAAAGGGGGNNYINPGYYRGWQPGGHPPNNGGNRDDGPSYMWNIGSSVSSAAWKGTTSILGAGVGMVGDVANMALNLAIKGLNSFGNLLMKMTSPAGVLQKFVDMFSFEGMIGSSQAITQRSFFSNAVGINPNDIFRLNATYGRLADPGNVLSGIASARAAPFSLGLATAGISQQEARSMSTEELTWKMTDLARNYARNPRWGANEMTLGATGLGQFFSVQDMLRIGNLSEKEYSEIRDTSSRYESSSKLKDPEAWRHFETERAIGMAGAETAIQNKMTRLLLPVENLINTVKKGFEKGGGANAIDSALEGVVEFINRINELFQSESKEEFFEILKRDAKDLGEYTLDRAKEAWDFVHEWAQNKFPEATEKMDAAFSSALEFGKSLKDLIPSFDDIRKAASDAEEVFRAIKEWMIKFHLIDESSANEGALSGLPPDVPGSLNKGLDYDIWPSKPKIKMGKRFESAKPSEFSGLQQSEITSEDIDNLRDIYNSLPEGAEKKRVGKMLADAVKQHIKGSGNKSDPLDSSEGWHGTPPYKDTPPSLRKGRVLENLRDRKERGDRGKGLGNNLSSNLDDSTSPGTVIRSVPRNANVDIKIKSDNQSNIMVQSMRTAGSLFGGGFGY